MEITIDMESPDPLFAQLMDGIRGAILKGDIAPGDPLKSIRQLALDLDLNNKTVAKAYKLLERDSVIQTRGYRGTFVHPDAINNCQVDMGAWVREKLDEAIGTLRDAGVTDTEIRVAFGDAMNNTPGKET